jgi:hypothetical protein
LWIDGRSQRSGSTSVQKTLAVTSFVAALRYYGMPKE